MTATDKTKKSAQQASPPSECNEPGGSSCSRYSDIGEERTGPDASIALAPKQRGVADQGSFSSIETESTMSSTVDEPSASTRCSLDISRKSRAAAAAAGNASVLDTSNQLASHPTEENDDDILTFEGSTAPVQAPALEPPSPSAAPAFSPAVSETKSTKTKSSSTKTAGGTAGTKKKKKKKRDSKISKSSVKSPTKSEPIKTASVRSVPSFFDEDDYDLDFEELGEMGLNDDEYDGFEASNHPKDLEEEKIKEHQQEPDNQRRSGRSTTNSGADGHTRSRSRSKTRKSSSRRRSSSVGVIDTAGKKSSSSKRRSSSKGPLSRHKRRSKSPDKHEPTMVETETKAATKTDETAPLKTSSAHGKPKSKSRGKSPRALSRRTSKTKAAAVAASAATVDVKAGDAGTSAEPVLDKSKPSVTMSRTSSSSSRANRRVSISDVPDSGASIATTASVTSDDVNSATTDTGAVDASSTKEKGDSKSNSTEKGVATAPDTAVSVDAVVATPDGTAADASSSATPKAKKRSKSPGTLSRRRSKAKGVLPIPNLVAPAVPDASVAATAEKDNVAAEASSHAKGTGRSKSPGPLSRRRSKAKMTPPTRVPAPAADTFVTLDKPEGNATAAFEPNASMAPETRETNVTDASSTAKEVDPPKSPRRLSRRRSKAKGVLPAPGVVVNTNNTASTPDIDASMSIESSEAGAAATKNAADRTVPPPSVDTDVPPPPVNSASPRKKAHKAQPGRSKSPGQLLGSKASSSRGTRSKSPAAVGNTLRKKKSIGGGDGSGSAAKSAPPIKVTKNKFVGLKSPGGSSATSPKPSPSGGRRTKKKVKVKSAEITFDDDEDDGRVIYNIGLAAAAATPAPAATTNPLPSSLHPPPIDTIDIGSQQSSVDNEEASVSSTYGLEAGVHSLNALHKRPSLGAEAHLLGGMTMYPTGILDSPPSSPEGSVRPLFSPARTATPEPERPRSISSSMCTPSTVDSPRRANAPTSGDTSSVASGAESLTDILSKVRRKSTVSLKEEQQYEDMLLNQRRASANMPAAFQFPDL